MLQIDLPNIDNIKLWDEIVSNKRGIHKSNLLQCRHIVLERYVFYQSHYESLEEITPLDTQFWENIKEDLHSCYGNNVAFSRARKKLLSSAPKCPYCLLNRPNTLDHYFDKSDYPEYSVFAPNLIPCCSECNSLKGTRLFNDDQQRQFIHFYIDNIPNYQYLFVHFCVGIQAGTFDIKILNRLAGGFFIEQFEFWTPIIKTKRKDDKEKTMQHYDEFEDVVNRLKAMRKSNR